MSLNIRRVPKRRDALESPKAGELVAQRTEEVSTSDELENIIDDALRPLIVRYSNDSKEPDAIGQAVLRAS